MSAILLAALLLTGSPEDEATPAFDPFVAVGVCPIASGLRPWSVVFHSFGDESPEEAQIASGRVFKHLQSPLIQDCLSRMIESDPTARTAAYGLQFAIDPDTLLRLDKAVRAVWIRYGVDAAVREVAAGPPGAATERLLTRCKELLQQEP